MTRSKMRAVVSWFFIVVTIFLIQITIYYGSKNAASLDSASSMQIQMSGKYFIGVRQLSAQNPLLEKRLSQLEQGILKSRGISNYISNVPIFAELSGRDAALQELKRMAANPEKVVGGKDIPIFYQLYEDGSASLDSQQVRTIKGYGWVGRLALSQDKPDSDPERKTVLRSAFHMVILAGLLSMLALAALFGGLVLLIVAIVKGVKGKLESHLVMPENPGILLLETFAVYLVLSTVMPLLLTIIVPGFRSGGILMTILAGFFSILWPIFRGAKWKDYRTALGWNRGKGFFREIGAGVVGYITGLPLMAMGLIFVMILVKHTGANPSHPVVFGLSRSPLYLFLLACVYAPFVEETLFRGALYGYLRGSLPWAVSGIITGFIFAILHPQGWVAVPVIGIIGFNLSAIREWRGSTIASMTAHALNNGSLVLILITALA